MKRFVLLALASCAVTGCKGKSPATRDAAALGDATVLDRRCQGRVVRWRQQTPPAQIAIDAGAGKPINFFDVWGAAANAIWIVGDLGVVLFYDGTNWTRQSTPSTQTLTAVWGSSSTDVWAAGFGGTVLHFDGTRWSDLSPPRATLSGPDAGTSARDGGNAPVVPTLWGGWSPAAPVAPAPAPPPSAAVVGEGGVLLSYAQGAWQRLQSGVLEDLFAVWGAPNGTIYAVGNFGVALRGQVGGAFSGVQTGTAKGLRAVWGRSASEVYAAGVGGTVLRLAGGRFSPIEGSPPHVYRGIWGPADHPDYLYLVGWDGVIVQLYGTGSDRSFGFQNCVTEQRLEGIWGRQLPPPPDGGVLDAAPQPRDARATPRDGRPSDLDLAVDAGPPPPPIELWVVGVNRTVLRGP